MLEPIRRSRWLCRQFGNDPDEAAPNAQGRSGVGATSHCAHMPKGAAAREFVDWRPFDYFTSRTLTPWAGAFVLQRPATETFEFFPIGGHGTKIVWRFRVTDRGRIALLTLRATRLLTRRFEAQASAALRSLIEEDAGGLGLSSTSDTPTSPGPPA